MELILDPLHLDYIITGEYLLITSEGRAEAEMETRVYDTRLLDAMEPIVLVSIIQGAIRPDTWGDESLAAAVEPFPGGLVITHNQRAHAEIADLFRQLMRHAAAQRDP